MKFKIEQVALRVTNPAAAKALLAKLGAGDWADDHVVAIGRVKGVSGTNEADLAFEYGMLGEAKELELLKYTEGRNWMEHEPDCVSHLGMHCTAVELEEFRAVFTAEGIPVVQEVRTLSHTNPAIRHSRRYHYVIFGTRPILGVDLKFIVRLPAPIPSGA